MKITVGLRHKLPAMVVCASFLSILAAGTLGYMSAAEGLKAGERNKLEALAKESE